MNALAKTLNPNEAPQGYFAVLKDDVKTAELGSICRACDWRSQCCTQGTDFENSNHRCMSDTLISSRTGKEIFRNDGCSVVFKKSSNFEKTANANRVLQMMDNVEDGDGCYQEFVELVAKEANISKSQLNKELEPFI